MWRTILCLLHVIYRSEPSTESLIVRFPCLLYLISYVFRWLQDTFAACMKERTCLYSKRPFSWQHIRTFVIIALVFVTFVWTPELSSFSTATNDDSFGSDSGGNGKNSVQLLPATDVSYSCTFDGDNWCGWMVSGEKGFTLRDHPPDPAAEAEKQKLELKEQFDQKIKEEDESIKEAKEKAAVDPFENPYPKGSIEHVVWKRKQQAKKKR